MEPNTNSPDPSLDSSQTPDPTPAPLPDLQPGYVTQPSPVSGQPEPLNPVIVSPDHTAVPSWDQASAGLAEPIAPPSSPVIAPGTGGTMPAPDTPVPTVITPPQLSNESAIPAGVPGQVISGGFDASASSLPPAAGVASQPPIPAFNPAPALPDLGATDLFAVTPPAPVKRRSLKPFLIALLAIVVLSGASAAAYVGIIVPNKPANVLQAAIINSLQQQQIRTEGTDEGGAASGDGLAYKLAFTSASNAAAKASDVQLNLTVSGITFPVEARLVNQNLYIKVGDLSAITGLVNAYSPDAGSLVQSVSSDISNKWIVVDSTILDEDATIKCLLNTNTSLNNTDITLLKNQYVQHPFVTIQSTSSATINGKAAEKFILSADDDKAATYFNGLTNLSIVQNVEKCPGLSTSTKPNFSGLADHDKTPLTVWVDKSSKRIVQISAQSTAQDAQKSNLAGSLTVSLQYGNVSIAAPSNAEPALQVLAQIQSAVSSNPNLLNLFSGGLGSTGTTPDTSISNTLTQ
ncbi:MAG TPA: hypothetical protein VK712_00910 [Verrucomicrobiae bacterium]|jgi:hypothetical protein|nr:hypothetical protein [Verrucomicrobiae bacterium]